MVPQTSAHHPGTWQCCLVCRTCKSGHIPFVRWSGGAGRAVPGMLWWKQSEGEHWHCQRALLIHAGLILCCSGFGPDLGGVLQTGRAWKHVGVCYLLCRALVNRERLWEGNRAVKSHIRSFFFSTLGWLSYKQTVESQSIPFWVGWWGWRLHWWGAKMINGAVEVCVLKVG